MTSLVAAKAILCLGLLLLAPGLATLAQVRHEKDKARLSLLEALFLAVVASVLTSSWLGLVLAELGQFSLGNLLLLVGLLSLFLAGAAVWRWRASPATSILSGVLSLSRFRPRYETVALVVVLVVAAVLYAEPAEAIFGTHDAGAHLAAGVHIAESGGILIDDPAFGDIANNADFGKFLGVLALEPEERGVLVPQFAGVYETWIAVFYSIFHWQTGLNPLPALDFLGVMARFARTAAFLYVTPVFGWLGVVALYFVGRRLMSEWVGLLASLFLAISLPQIWYSRLSMAEVLTQFLLLGGLYAFTLYQETDEGFYGLVAGAALGVALLTRIDAGLAYLPALAWLALLAASGRLRRHHGWFFLPALLLLAQAGAHYIYFSADQLRGPVGDVAARYGGTAALAVAVLVGLGVGWRRLERRARGAGQWLPGLKVVLVLGVLVLAAYAYFLRPLQSAPQLVYSLPMSEAIPFQNEENLTRLGWYVSPWGLLLGVAGLCLLIYRRLDRRTAALVLLAAVYAAVFVYNAYVTPHHLFWVRRYLPVVIPALMLFAAYAILVLPTLLPWRRAAGGLALALAALLAMSLASISQVAAGPSQYQGAIYQTSQLARQFEGPAVLVFEDSDAAKWLALPLNYLYGKDALTLKANQPDAERLRRTVEGWWARGQRVYYVSQKGSTTISPADFDFRPVGEAWFRFPYLEMVYDRLPSKTIYADLNVEVYELRPAKVAPPGFPYVVDLGTFDYGYLVRGFHGREKGGPDSYRLTAAVAEMALPWPQEGDNMVLSLRASGERPEGVAPAQVAIYVNDTLVDRFSYGNDYENRGLFQVHRLVVPRSAGGDSGQARLRIETNPWVPAEVGLGDIREIGIRLDWLRVEVE